MSSAEFTEDIKPAYFWDGYNWVKINDPLSTYENIVSASAAAYSSASAYTDSASASIVDYIDNLTTTDIEEGSNLYFTEERSLNTASSALVHDNHLNILATYNSASSQIILTGLSGGGGGSVVGGTNINVNYNEELNTYTVNTNSDLENIDSISTPNFIEFNTEFVPDNGMPEGSLYWNDEDQTLDVALKNEVVLSLGQDENYPPVFNNSGVQINKGDLVMVTGVQGDKLTIAKAVSDGTVDFDYIIGIAAHDIPNTSDTATIIKFGYVNPVDTNSYDVGTILYPDRSVPGGLTNILPDAPGYKIPIAIVTKRGTGGRILVRMSIPSRLGESDSNVQFTSLENDDILIYNSASSLWINSPIQDYINTASAAAVLSSNSYTDEEILFVTEVISSASAQAILDSNQYTDEEVALGIVTASAAAAAYTDQEISDLVAGAPEALDTLYELAAALNDDENFASTVINTITNASAYSLSEASGYTDESIDNKFVHEDHVNVEVEYNETSNRIIITAEGVPKTSYGTIYPDFEGEEEEIYYQINEEKTKVVARYVYLDGEWRLFSEEAFTWESLSLQTWQWLLDNSELDGWEFLVEGQSSIGNVDFNTRFVPNLIADIRYLQKNEFGDALVSGSAVIINSLSSGIPTLNGGIKVKRGDEDPVELRWNEDTKVWEFTEDGINYKKLGSGAVLYEEEEPETEDLEVGTLWIDSDQDSISGLQAQTFSRWIKTLQTSASVFSGVDDNITPLKYVPDYEQVFMNGTLLVRDEDYIANDGLIITLLESGVENDTIEIHSFEPFLIADSYTREQVETLFATKTELNTLESNASATYVAKVDTQLVKYGSDEPIEPEEGMIWIDSTNILKPITKVYNGSTWIIASGQADAAIHPFFLAGI